jgi:putative membrane protein
MTKPAVAGLMLAATVAACAKKDDTAADSMAARTDTSAAAAATANPDSMNVGKWTPAATVGFATAANQGEIDMGKLGETKATNAEVKAFAKEQVTDHTKMLADAASLGTKLNAVADTAAGDAHDLMGHTRDEIKDLTDKAKGADWDKNYMDKMIEDHQKVLEKLQDAAKSNTNADVTKALTDASAKVQEHLTKAQAIRAKLP